MSIFDKMGKGLGDFFGGTYHFLTGTQNAAQKRPMQTLMNDQIQAYRQQSELTRQELDRTRGAEQAQNRLIQEKQIRSLRRNYRPAGIMATAEQGTPAQGNLGDSAAGASSGMTNKLGG